MLVWQLAERFGPVFAVHLGSGTIVALRGYKAAKEALLQHKNELSGREFAVSRCTGQRYLPLLTRPVVGAWGLAGTGTTGTRNCKVRKVKRCSDSSGDGWYIHSVITQRAFSQKLL